MSSGQGVVLCASCETAYLSAALKPMSSEHTPTYKRPCGKAPVCRAKGKRSSQGLFSGRVYLFADTNLQLPRGWDSVHTLSHYTSVIKVPGMQMV